jgi:hypothetical protein
MNRTAREMGTGAGGDTSLRPQGRYTMRRWRLATEAMLADFI